MSKTSVNSDLYGSIKAILVAARGKAFQTVNSVMVEAYWHVGRLIAQEELKGKRRATYGEQLLENLSLRLSKDFGKGFDPSNLTNMLKFYQMFPILDALRQELSWTHYRLLIRIDNPKARDFYLKECAHAHWSTRQLERQIVSHYYERLLKNRNQQLFGKPKEPSGVINDHLKDPLVLEFLGLQGLGEMKESQLEQALIDHLQKFLLELGRGFSFVGRQVRISTETQHFYIDLVFYNYVLKCFVLIDLKTGKLTHQDIGQMDMYVRLFESTMKQATDNPTIGIILCEEKDATVVKYSVLSDSKKLFASKYKFYFPTEKELSDEIEREKQILRLSAARN